jgi:uncharacterized damage-inducible protein DinB
MKEIFTQYAAYNLWANEQFAEVIEGITPSYVDKEIESSFPSIRGTINHIRSAEYIWLNRLQGNLLTEWPQYDLKESTKDLATAWLLGSKQLAIYLEKIIDTDFEQEYEYKDMKGNPHTDKLSNIMMHLFNHSGFHRGQLVTLFRQSGISIIPRTDYIVYARGLK